MAKMVLSRNIVIITFVIILTVLILGSILLVFMKPSSTAEFIPLVQDGVREGDYFDYDVTGTFNNTTVNGTYRIDMGSGLSWSIRKNMSDPSLNATLDQDSPFVSLNSRNEVGTGKYSSSYGVKDVVWLFKANQKWVSICYSGTDPAIIYGAVVIGQNIHLDIILNDTDNPWAITNNTSILSLDPEPTPDTNQGGIGMVDNNGTTGGTSFYTENGGLLQYFLNATDVDVLAYSDGNIRSMAEGGPFAFDPRLTRLHSGNMTGEIILPRGFYWIVFVGHTDHADITEPYPHHSVTWTFTKY